MPYKMTGLTHGIDLLYQIGIQYTMLLDNECQVVENPITKLGRISDAREHWGAAAESIQNTANGLSDLELREGFLEAKPIREILSKAEN